MQDMMAPIEISKALASLQTDRRIARELHGRGNSPRAYSGDGKTNISSTPMEPLVSGPPLYKGRLSGPQYQSGVRSPKSPSIERRGASPSAGALSPMPVDILDPHALISVDIMIVEPNLHRDNWEPIERIQVVSIQFNSLGMYGFI